MLTPGHVSGHHLWKVSQTIVYHANRQCLSAPWWIMTIKAGGGGGTMIVCLVLFRLKQIIPAELPCAGLCSPKEYLSISVGITRPVCKICFLSENWDICAILGPCCVNWVVCHLFYMHTCVCVFVVQRPLKISDTKSMDLYLIVKPRLFCPTTGNPATLRSQQRRFCQDLSRNPRHRLTRFPQRTLRSLLSVSLPLLHLPWSKAMPLSLLNLTNARQVKWRSRTTSLNFPSASHASSLWEILSQHPVRWYQQKVRLLTGWCKAMLAWWGGSHMVKTCTAQTVTHCF